MTVSFSSRHTDIINEIACGQQWMATISPDGTIIVYHLPDCESTDPLDTHTDANTQKSNYKKCNSDTQKNSPIYLQTLSIHDALSSRNQGLVIVDKEDYFCEACFSDSLFDQNDYAEGNVSDELSPVDDKELYFAAGTKQGKLFIWRFHAAPSKFLLENTFSLSDASVANVAWTWIYQDKSKVPLLTINLLDGTLFFVYGLYSSFHGTPFSWVVLPYHMDDLVSCFVWVNNVTLLIITRLGYYHLLSMEWNSESSEHSLHLSGDTETENSALNDSQKDKLYVRQMRHGFIDDRSPITSAVLSPSSALPFRYLALVRSCMEIWILRLFEDEELPSHPQPIFSIDLTGKEHGNGDSYIKSIQWSIMGTCLWVTLNENDIVYIRENHLGSWQVYKPENL